MGEEARKEREEKLERGGTEEIEEESKNLPLLLLRTHSRVRESKGERRSSLRRREQRRERDTQRKTKRKREKGRGEEEREREREMYRGERENAGRERFSF